MTEWQKITQSQDGMKEGWKITWYPKRGIILRRDMGAISHAIYSSLSRILGDFPPLHHFVIPSFHHSTIPPFYHSTIPPFHNSTFPPFHHSIFRPFHHSRSPSILFVSGYYFLQNYTSNWCFFPLPCFTYESPEAIFKLIPLNALSRSQPQISLNFERT